MAVHTGDAQLRGDRNYVGRTIIRCARLRACGHGGQILVSDATAAVVADDLPEGVSLDDLGMSRLKDLHRPVRIWQLVSPELPCEFPPLRSLEATPNNLPSAVSSLVGRERELGELIGMLGRERLVTITGSGGCGKTRLAQHAAAEAAESFRGGVWWVELAPLTSGAAVADAAATAARIEPVASQDATRAIVARLRLAGATLLVVDNAEHVIDAVARLADAVLSGCPEARLLVTSREPLGVPGERVWRVPPLSAPGVGEHVSLDRLTTFDAAQLFIERARQARPNLVIDDRTAPFVAAIAARLDGIPLALELAAARARSLPLERLAAGIDQAFLLLTGGARMALPRQQTLLASIAWSFDLLDPVERAVARRLAVFHGSFSLDAAEAVAGDGELVNDIEVLDVVGRLVDKSLIQLDDLNDRYRMLETIRQFGLDRLRETGEASDVRVRHCDWITQWWVEAGRGDHGLAFSPGHHLIPDLLAALEWAYDESPKLAYEISSALGWIRPALGHFHALDRQYDWVVGRDSSDDPIGWARAIAGLGLSALGIMRSDYPRLAAQARAQLPADDRASRRMLDVHAGMATALLDGTDDSLLRSLVAEADDDHDDLALRHLGGLLCIRTYSAGDLDVGSYVIERVRAMLDRRGLPFSALTADLVLPLAALHLRERGMLDEAAELLGATGPCPADVLAVLAAALALVGSDRGDLEMIDEGARMAEGEHPGMNQGTTLLPAYCRHSARGEWSEASALGLRIWELTPLSPALKMMGVRSVVIALLASGSGAEASALVEQFAADVERTGWLPGPTTILRDLQAQFARVPGHTDDVLRAADAAVLVASAHGLVLLTIDALDLFAEATAPRDPVLAARIFGTTTAKRNAIGYRARYVPDRETVDALVDHLRTEQSAAFTEGAARTIDEIVELIGRQRVIASPSTS